MAYCSTDTSVATCPKCGSELSFANYYTGIKGATNIVSSKSERDWGAGKIVTTTVRNTKYTDVREHTGAVCMYCTYHGLYMELLIARIMIVLGALGVIFAAVQYIILDNPQVWILILGFVCFFAAGIGWKIMGNGGLFCANPYKVKKGISPFPGYAAMQNEFDHNYVSDYLKSALFIADDIPKERTVLSRRDVKGFTGKNL